MLRFETAHPSARAATHPAPGQIAIAVADPAAAAAAARAAGYAVEALDAPGGGGGAAGRAGAPPAVVVGPDGYRYVLEPRDAARAERFVSVTLRVPDPAAAARWYVDVLGMRSLDATAAGGG